jgi:hypothetical protein
MQYPFKYNMKFKKYTQFLPFIITLFRQNKKIKR